MDNPTVAKLFAVFQTRYGHKWTSALPDADMVRLAVSEWRNGLDGLSPEDIKRGLDGWRDAWPPSLPEFRAACLPTPEELGYPNATEALEMARRISSVMGGGAFGFDREREMMKRYPYIMDIVRDTFGGVNEFRNTPSDRAFKQFKSAYNNHIHEEINTAMLGVDRKRLT